MNAISCQQCGHNNDYTRVFCQECGARLERPANAPPSPSAPPLAAGPQRHLAKPRSPGLSIGKLLSSLIRIVVFAALLAVVIQVLRAPVNIPAAGEPAGPQADVLKRLVESASQSSVPISIGASQDAVNGLLASSVKITSVESSSVLKAEFQRIFIVFIPGTLEVGMEQKLFGHSIYIMLDLVPEKSGGTWGARATGAQIGRLPIHPLLAPFIQRLFSPLAGALQPEIARLSNLDSIEIRQGSAILKWGTRPPAP